MNQTFFFSVKRAARFSCLVSAVGFSIITGCAKVPTAPAPHVEGPAAWTPAGRYQEIDSNWVSGICESVTTFRLKLDSSSTATELEVSNGERSILLASYDTASRIRASSLARFDGNALISSSEKRGDSVVVVFSMTKNDQANILAVCVRGDTIRGSIYEYGRNKSFPVTAMKMRD